jgi:endonuclease YncB( thermonuclease family)
MTGSMLNQTLIKAGLNYRIRGADQNKKQLKEKPNTTKKTKLYSWCSEYFTAHTAARENNKRAI